MPIGPVGSASSPSIAAGLWSVSWPVPRAEFRQRLPVIPLRVDGRPAIRGEMREEFFRLQVEGGWFVRWLAHGLFIITRSTDETTA